ncbi:MAG: TonB-dependent receptor [candidate division Zixibacteria bacterium]|nr:TonB-dependent receptor [candidate division Zixibacteria bacterium]
MAGAGKILVLFVILLLFGFGLLWAGTTGKLSGVIIDDGDKSPLPGATIRVVGTSMGTFTQPDGSYVILNVPPGSHEVRVSFVGYQEKIIKGIQISADLTTTLNEALKATPVELEPVIVEIDKLNIDKHETQNLRRISSDQISDMTVKNVDELLSTQVGFVTRGGQLHVRGGRAGEVVYMVDGVATRDPLGGRLAVKGGMNVSAEDIEEVSILKGGFDAEYGDALSAVINIVTKEGNVHSTKGSVEYLTDDFGDPKLNKYSFNTDRFRFSLNGPDPFVTSKLMPALGLNFMRDKLSYSFSFDVFKSDGAININNYAPPGVKKEFRTDDLLSFTWPGVFSYSSGISVPERMTNQYNGSIKLVYNAKPTRKLTFSYRKSVNRYTSTETDLIVDRRPINVWNFRYNPSFMPVYDEQNITSSLSFSENIGRNSLLELQVSRFEYRRVQLPGGLNGAGDVTYPDQFYLFEEWESQSASQDANKNGQWDAAEQYVDRNNNGQYDIGEPFEDMNKGKNGVWDPGEYFQDVDGDGAYTQGVDVFDPGAYDTFGEGKWDDAESFVDTNGDGIYNPERSREIGGARDAVKAEAYQDGDINLGEPFTDKNGDNIYQPFEPWVDANEDGFWNPGESYQDLNQNGQYDAILDIFTTCNCPDNDDLNFNGEYDSPQVAWSPGVPYLDLNKNSQFDLANGRWDPGEPFADANGNGRFDNRQTLFESNYDRATAFEDHGSITWTLKTNFTSQIRREHELKTGFELSYYELSMNQIYYPWLEYTGVIDDGGPYPGRGTYRDFYNREPSKGALYVQDKIEYGTMTAKLGVRYDFYLQSKDLTEKTLIPGEQDPEKTIVEAATGEITYKSRNQISPRMGVAYPVSDVAKVYFNYGHFYQLAPLTYMFRRTTQGRNAESVYTGNPNLDYSKTVQYELGIQYAMSDDYTLDISGFYKDYFGLINSTRVNINGVDYEVYGNVDYGRARGLEVQLDKRRGNYFNGYANYQYAFAYGKNSFEEQNRFTTIEQGASVFIPLREWPLDWDVRHQVTVSLDLRVRKGDHPRVFGVRMLDNWGINLLWQYSSGLPFTPDRSYPGIEGQLVGNQVPRNAERLPADSRVDMRLNKDFQFLKLNYSLELYVYNLLDQKTVDQVYLNTGRPDTSINAGGAILPGTENDQNPLFYGPGRNIRLGLRMDF